jgi:hypothetical protein
LPVVQKDIQVQGLSNFAEIKPVAFYIWWTQSNLKTNINETKYMKP